MSSKVMPDFLSPSTEPTRLRRATEKLVPDPKARLREQVREVARFTHLSERMEEVYGNRLWRRLLRFSRREIYKQAGPLGLTLRTPPVG